MNEPTITLHDSDHYCVTRRFNLAGLDELAIVEQIGDEDAPQWERATIRPTELTVTYTWQTGHRGTAEPRFTGMRVRPDGTLGTIATGTVQQHRQPAWLGKAVEVHAPDGWRAD